MNYIFWIQVTQQHFDAFFLSFVTIVFLYDVGFLHSKLSEEHYFENWVRNCRIVVRLGLKNFKNRKIVAATQSLSNVCENRDKLRFFVKGCVAVGNDHSIPNRLPRPYHCYFSIWIPQQLIYFVFVDERQLYDCRQCIVWVDDDNPHSFIADICFRFRLAWPVMEHVVLVTLELFCG